MPASSRINATITHLRRLQQLAHVENEERLDRHENGRFRVGHKRIGGRKPGSLNRWSQAKDGWLDAYGLPLDALDLTEEDRALAAAYGIDTAGAWKLFQLLKDDSGQYFKLGQRSHPK